jgi:hypothetical protein
MADLTLGLDLGSRAVKAVLFDPAHFPDERCGPMYLPANLCPLIKSSFGFALEKANPLFEMSDLVVTETTCDGKKKMFERLQDFKPMHVLELPQKPDDEGSFLRWKAEIRSSACPLDGWAPGLERGLTASLVMFYAFQRQRTGNSGK